MGYKKIKIKANNLKNAYNKAENKIENTYKIIQKHVILMKPTKKRDGLYLIFANKKEY